MKNTKGFAPITLILILVGVLFIGGGVYYWQKQKSETGQQSTAVPAQSQLNPAQQPSVAPTVTENIIKPQQSTATSSVFTVGSDGGTIVFPDGKAQITFPDGALSSPTTMKAAITIDTGEQIGPYYEIYLPNLSDLALLKPITIKISYDPRLLPAGANEGKTKLAMVGPIDSWYLISDSSIDVVNHTITALTVSIYWAKTKGVAGGIFDSPGIIAEFGVLPHYGN